MRKSRMQKLAIACIAAFAVFGGIGVTNAQSHGGSHAGGGGFHGGGSFHSGGEFHSGGSFHGGGAFHGHAGFHGDGFHAHSHGHVIIGAPIIVGPGYYPYGYSYPGGYVPDAADVEPQYSGSNYWYCDNPAGYYPDVQNCSSGWLQVAPNPAPTPGAG